MAKMKTTSPKVDDYIEQAPEFAQPILTKLRRLFHRACPDIEETIKWGCPHFVQNGIVGGMAAFKHHVNFGFWKGKLLSDPEKLFSGVGDTKMNALKIKRVSELPADRILIAYMKEAAKLNEKAPKSASVKTKKVKKTKKPKAPIKLPPDLLAALKKNKKARTTFDTFSPSHRKEYVEWITSAKRDETRQRRLATAIEWMAEGKPRHWKYKNC